MVRIWRPSILNKTIKLQINNKTMFMQDRNIKKNVSKSHDHEALKSLENIRKKSKT